MFAVAGGQDGWRYQDDLARMLRCDDRKIYLDAFRARRQLSGLGVEDAADLIERRRSTRQLRLGPAAIALRDHGHYEGLLPHGSYALDQVPFEVIHGRPPVQLTTPAAAPPAVP